MPSIINGLFSGRSGIASHGAAIAVAGDNISNSSTIGYKASRAEFEDLVAGGQAAGRIIGSGSSTSAVNTIFDQGTLEFTGRTLDLAIDGNGFFAVQDTSGNLFYTRAGNFKLDTSGNIINQNNLQVLGYPAGGTGALEAINVNQVSQANIASSEVGVSGNLDASATTILAASIPAAPLAGAGGDSTAVSFADLNAQAAFSTVVNVFDTLGAQHTLTYFFFHTGSNQYTARAYARSEEFGENVSGYPRQIRPASGTVASGTFNLVFNSDGSLDATNSTNQVITMTIPWSNGSSTAQTIDLDLTGFTQYSSPSTVEAIRNDGQGIGDVTSIVIDDNGDIFAKLSNGQSATIGVIGLVNFSNPEGLTRVGNNLLQQSPSSGAPLIGRPDTGTFGTVSSGSLELSTVDIANEFVKLITLQRGFQANSRIITTINQLLNEIIQLA